MKTIQQRVEEFFDARKGGLFFRTAMISGIELTQLLEENLKDLIIELKEHLGSCWQDNKSVGYCTLLDQLKSQLSEEKKEWCEHFIVKNSVIFIDKGNDRDLIYAYDFNFCPMCGKPRPRSEKEGE